MSLTVSLIRGPTAVLVLLAGCVADASLSRGELTPGDFDQLRELGIHGVERDGDGIVLLGAEGEHLGAVQLWADAFEVELRGATARLDLDASSATWQCDDWHQGTASTPGTGLRQWLAEDALMVPPCADALTAGWVVRGVYGAPPEGCERVLLDGRARLVCGDGDRVEAQSAALLAHCGGGGTGGGGWGSGDCTNDGSGCEPACPSCTSSFGGTGEYVLSSSEALCSDGGGGGGGGEIGCSNAQIRDAQDACRISCEAYSCATTCAGRAGQWCCQQHLGIHYCRVDPMETTGTFYQCARTTSTCGGD